MMNKRARLVGCAATALFVVALFTPVVKDSTATVDTGFTLLLRFLFYSVNPFALVGYLVECPQYLLQVFVPPSALIMLFGAFLAGRRLRVRIPSLVFLTLGLLGVILTPARPGGFVLQWGWFPMVTSYVMMFASLIKKNAGQQDDGQLSSGLKK